MRRVTVDELKRVRDGHLWFGPLVDRVGLRAVGETIRVERDEQGRVVRSWVRLGEGVIEYARREP